MSSEAKRDRFSGSTPGSVYECLWLSASAFQTNIRGSWGVRGAWLGLPPRRRTDQSSSVVCCVDMPRSGIYRLFHGCFHRRSDDIGAIPTPSEVPVQPPALDWGWE